MEFFTGGYLCAILLEGYFLSITAKPSNISFDWSSSQPTASATCQTICNKHRSVMILLVPIRGRGGEDGINWWSRIICSAPYHQRLNTTTAPLITFRFVSGPFYEQLCPSDTGVVKGVVTQSSLMDADEQGGCKSTRAPPSPLIPEGPGSHATVFEFGSLGSPFPFPSPSLSSLPLSSPMCEGSTVGCKRHRGDLQCQETTTTFIHSIAIYLHIMDLKRNHLWYCVMRVCDIDVFKSKPRDYSVFPPRPAAS